MDIHIIVLTSSKDRHLINTRFYWANLLRFSSFVSDSEMISKIEKLKCSVRKKPIVLAVEDWPVYLINSLRELKWTVNIYTPIRTDRVKEDCYVNSIEHICVEIVDRSNHPRPEIEVNLESKQFYVYYIEEVCRDESKIIRYVGKGTYDPDGNGYSRIACHEHMTPKSRLYKEVYEKGNSLEIRMVEVFCNEADAHHAEIDHIKKLRELGTPLINKTTGGDSGWTLSLEARKSMSAARIGIGKGVPLSEEHKNNLKKAAKIRASNPEWRARHSKALSGRVNGPLSYERKLNISKAVKGYKHSVDTKNKMQSAAKSRRFCEVIIFKSGVPFYSASGQMVSESYPYLKCNGQGKNAIERISDFIKAKNEIPTYEMSKILPRDDFMAYWKQKWKHHSLCRIKL